MVLEQGLSPPPPSLFCLSARLSAPVALLCWTPLACLPGSLGSLALAPLPPIGLTVPASPFPLCPMRAPWKPRLLPSAFGLLLLVPRFPILIRFCLVLTPVRVVLTISRGWLVRPTPARWIHSCFKGASRDHTPPGLPA